MKKLMILFLIGVLILPSVLAIDLGVEKIGTRQVMVAEIARPATFDLQVTNYGDSDNFGFSNLLGFNMLPIDMIHISSGETKDAQLLIYPRDNFDYRGFYKFEYSIFGQNEGLVVEELVFEIINMEDAFEIGANNFDANKNSFDVYVLNKRNFNFENISIEFSSPFFDLEKDLFLGPNEKYEFEVVLDNTDFKKLMAGFYTLRAEVNVDGVVADVEGIIDFTEHDSLITEEKDYGWIINTKIVEKINDGNVLQGALVVMKKNLFTRLFTSFSPEPSLVDRQGFSVYYTWEEQLKPSESLEVVVKTNWLFPLLVVLFVVVIVVFAKLYSKTNVILKKRVSFVRAKGGEFALKVSLFVKARKYVEKVTIIDKLPALVKLYEKFGIEKPTKIDAKNKKIEWDFEKLEAGETRVLNYIIYSKVGVLGKFALPSATAIYEREGEIKESESNRAFFVAEQGGK